MKDGKLFGKISIVDIMAVLLVLLLIAGIGVKFFGEDKIQVTSGEKLECVFRVKNVRDFTVEALKKGGKLYDKTTKEYIGEIETVTTEATDMALLLADGTYREVQVEDRYDVLVSVMVEGKQGEKGYYTATNGQLSVGGSMGIHTKYSQCDAVVESIGPAK